MLLAVPLWIAGTVKVDDRWSGRRGPGSEARELLVSRLKRTCA